MRRVFFAALVLMAISVGLFWAAAYDLGPVIVTREDQNKIVLRLGNPVQTIDEPGISWRWPLLDTVRVFDRRLQYLNAQPVEMLIARSEKLIIDFYAVWRITDALAFLRNYPGGVERAEDRIQETVNSLVGAKIGGLDLRQLLERAEAISSFDEESTLDLRGTGVEIVDVRLNRIELPRAAEPAAYSQMREQRRALSREHRAIGERRAREVRASADRQARLVLATAEAKAEITRGEGDAESARIYADAYSRDPEFYGFLRSLEAYREVLRERATMVLPPDHGFFRFLDPEARGSSAGRARPAVSAPAATAPTAVR
jgi:membrane protease subunit HflC